MADVKNRIVEYATRVFLVLALSAALLISLSTEVYAASDSIVLRLGGEGATSWRINNIKPGDSGTKTITICNAGSRTGFVTIWISELSTKGELYKHLLLGISLDPVSRLKHNLSLPTTVNRFPQDASRNLSYLVIDPLNAGEMVTLVWQWKLPFETGNEAQGGSFSFALNFRLEQLPFSSSGDDDGGHTSTLTLAEVAGSTNLVTSTITTDSTGTAQSSGQLTTLDGKLSIKVDAGTRLLDAAGRPLTFLSVTVPTTTAPPPPQGAVILIYDFGPEGATFSPPLTLTLSYDPLELPQSVEETELYIAYWDGTQWLPLESVVDTTTKTVSAKVSHFSQFALLYNMSLQPICCAAFQLGKLWIGPSQVEPGQEVTITVKVANIGGSEGTYTAELKINGKTEESKTIILPPGASKLVTFVVIRDIPGTYQVSINNLSGEFMVTLLGLTVAPVAPVPPTTPEIPEPMAKPPAMPAPDWTPIGSTIGAAFVVFLLVYLLWRGRRQQRVLSCADR